MLCAVLARSKASIASRACWYSGNTDLLESEGEALIKRCGGFCLQGSFVAAVLKISAVKHKGPNPNWVPQNGRMQPEGSGLNNKGKGKEQPSGPTRGKRAGRDKKKGDLKEKAHGHLASIAIGITDSLSQNLPGYSEHPLHLSISPMTCLTILLTKNYQNLRILM